MPRMLASPLRNDQYASDDDGGENGRSGVAAQSKAAVRERFIKEIAYGRAKRSRQDERGPEQQRVRQSGAIIGHGDPRETGREYQRPPRYPRPPLSAVQSPRAVPKVWENIMAPQ